MKISDLAAGVVIAPVDDLPIAAAGTPLQVHQTFGGEFYVLAPLQADEPTDLSLFFVDGDLAGFDLASGR